MAYSSHRGSRSRTAWLGLGVGRIQAPKCGSTSSRAVRAPDRTRRRLLNPELGKVDARSRVFFIKMLNVED
jgi:hypothetical protein